MKKYVLLATIAGLVTFTSCTSHSQSSLRDRLGSAGSSSTNSGPVTQSEATRGLKEALRIGAEHATKNLSSTDGYFRNQAIKILLPKEAQVVESTLRSVGMGDLVDETILKMNRAAEDAAIKARPIFISAITGMSIQDGLQILRGGEDAATKYLQRSTTTKLANEFRPVIQGSLSKVGADRIWATVFDNYNRMPLVRNKINPDLVGYVTEKALEGLFYSIAQEEMKIRANPGAQASKILRRVFG
ncbi:MAG TPA: DUF4197 domain-containing protein [Chitinophagaceae bacterium]|nr:DUF4197 domain-containing protein [Chitinophagaceae bacterium]